MRSTDTNTNDATPGWWVPANEWYEQRLWPVTGCWQQVRCANGRVSEACVLSGRNGWWNGNYEPVTNVIEWLKPSEWFDGPGDMAGKVAEWSAYKAKALANRTPLRCAA